MKKLFVAMLCAASSVASAEMTLNPDRWVSVEVQGNGSVDLNGKEDITLPPVSLSPGVAGHSAGFSTDVLVPLSDAWTLGAGIGTSFSKTTTDELPASGLAATSTNETTLDSQLGARYYFVNKSVGSSAPAENPDRWPSLALTVEGSNALHSHETDTALGVVTAEKDASKGKSIGFLADTRLPVSDAWTILAGINGTFNISTLAETATAAGIELRYPSISALAGARYYFVGKSLIAEDSHQNPDRWVSLSLVGDWLTDVGGHEATTFQGTETDQNIDAKAWSLQTELRAPVTNRLSVFVDLVGGYLRLSLPQTGALPGLKLTENVIGSSAGLRYYFE